MNDRAVHACVSGDGPSTVVLAAGAGQASGTWSLVARELTNGATPTRIARELRSLVEALEVEGSVVLVGHSMGGLHVLRYASLFPEGVAGVAILDTPPPGFEARRLTLLDSVEVAERGRALERGLANAPEAVRLEREGARDAREWDLSTFPRGVPLIVVAADSQDFGDLGNATAHRSLWITESRRWLSLSERAEFIVAEGSGHMVHHDRPALVVQAVRQLLAASGS